MMKASGQLLPGCFSRLRQEDGLTLTELLVTLMVLAVVSIIFTSTLASSLSATNDFESMARANDDIRLVLERIDREVRSADRICEPTPGQTSNRLEFRTRAYTTAVSTVTGTRTIIYELQDLDLDGTASDLVRSIDGGTTFAPVISTIVNTSVVDDKYNADHSIAAGTIGVHLFENQGRNEITGAGTPEATPSFGRVLTLRVWVDRSPFDNISPRMETTEVAGRNVWTPNSPGC